MDPPCASAQFWPKRRMETLLYFGKAWNEPPFLVLPWGFKKSCFFFRIHPFASTGNHRVLLHCFWSKGRMETLLYLGIKWNRPLLLIFALLFKNCGWFLKIHPFASKWSHRVFLDCFDQNEGWRLFSIPEIHGKNLPFSFYHEDPRNVVSSSKFVHCVKMEPPCVSGPFWSKRRMETLLLHLGNGWK